MRFPEAQTCVVPTPEGRVKTVQVKHDEYRESARSARKAEHQQSRNRRLREVRRDAKRVLMHMRNGLSHDEAVARVKAEKQALECVVKAHMPELHR